MKFRVKFGAHVEDGVHYREGEVLECDRDLCTVFANKFECVDSSVTSVPTPPVPVKKKEMKIVVTGDDMCDVINIATGARVNDEFLTLDEAKEIAGDNAPVEYAEVEKLDAEDKGTEPEEPEEPEPPKPSKKKARSRKRKS